MSGDAAGLVEPAAAWLGLAAIVILLVRRRARRAAGVGVALLALGLLYLLVEGVFVLALDTTDYVANTRLCRRWMARHAGVPNRLGHRDRERPPGPVDVAVLGDSFVWGQGIVEREARVDGRLAAHLAAAGRRVDVANWSYPGLGMREEEELFRRSVAGQGGAPRVLVHVYMWNDMAAPPGLEPLRRPGPWTAALLERSYSLDFAWHRLASLSGPARALGEAVAARYADPAAREEHAAELDRLRAAVEGAGAVYVCAGWPYHLPGPAWDGAYDWLRDLQRRRGVPYIDLREAFAGVPPAELRVGRFDHHPNERAADLAAAAIAARLLEVCPDRLPAPR